MDGPSYLRLVSPPKKEKNEVDQQLDPLARVKGVVLNLTQNALDCVNRISQEEMQKDPPSPDLLEKFTLLSHYLEFIKRVCQA